MAYTSGISSYTSKQQSHRFITFSLWSALHSKESSMAPALWNWAQAVYDRVKGKRPQVSHLKVKINPNQNLIWQNTQWYLFKYLNAIEICPSKIPKLFLKLNTDMLEALITTGCTWMRSCSCPCTSKHRSGLSALFSWGLLPNLGGPQGNKISQGCIFCKTKIKINYLIGIKVINNFITQPSSPVCIFGPRFRTH